MLIFKLMYLIKGYVVVKVKNANFEKITNLLRKNNVVIWDVEKNENEIKFKMSYDDYKKHIHIIKKTKVEMVKTKGFVFKLNKIKVRKGFIGGVFVLIICFYLLTSLVWNVQVIGPNQMTSNQVIEFLEENEINVPITHGSIDSKNIETLLYKKFDNFKFVEVYVEGSKLIIFVKEKIKEKAEIKSNEPTSIVSTKNAIINKVIAKSGQPVVKVGDVVYEGQTLVMGMVKNKNSDEFVMVPSEGTIYGKTYYNFELKEERLKEVNVATNKSKSVYYLKINEKSVKIIGDKDPYKNYNYKEYIIHVPLISNLINTNIVKCVYYEELVKTVEIDENSAKNKMKVSMYDDLLKICNKDSKILKSSLNFSEDEDNYFLRAQIEVIEDIGESVKIYPITEMNEELKNE